MRIGIYKDTLANKRGADVAVLALAEGLRERGHEVAVFEKADFAARIKEPWDVIISTGTNELLDLYNYFSTRSTRSARTKIFPFPVIQQFHTNPRSQFKWKRFLRNWRIRQALRHVSAIQVLSEEFVPQVAKYGPKVVVIGNWSAFDSQSPIPNSHLSTIIYPAAFARGKNQKLLIEAFLRVANEFPEWKLRLLGKAEGRYADECRRLAARLSGAMGSSRPTGDDGGGIEFAGYSNDMASEYAQCAFVAFPSLDEGFPLTIVDAAAFAKPCVMVEDWIGTAAAGGGIVTKPTVRAYADGLRRLMADKELRRQMGERAREFCAEHYSREEILDRWEAMTSSGLGIGNGE